MLQATLNPKKRIKIMYRFLFMAMLVVWFISVFKVYDHKLTINLLKKHISDI